jgi:hypothetical protein
MGLLKNRRSETESYSESVMTQRTRNCCRHEHWTSRRQSTYADRQSDDATDERRDSARRAESSVTAVCPLIAAAFI